MTPEAEAAHPDFLDGARAEYRECLEVRRLLGYLWTATGRNSRIPVYEMFDQDDPIRADIERLAILEKALYLSALVELYDVLDGPTLALKLSAKTQQALAHAWHVAHPDWSPE